MEEPPVSKMYGISVTFHQIFLTLKICYVKTKKFSIKSWTRWTYIYVANTSFNSG